MNIREYHAAQKALNDTGCKHLKCPARVIYGGRCKKDCPFWKECLGVTDLNVGFDHEHLRLDKDGNRQFVSVHHGFVPGYLNEKMDAFCAHHRLKYEVTVEEFNGLKEAHVVTFSKA